MNNSPKNDSPRNTRSLRQGIGLCLTLAAVVAVVGLTASIVWAAVGLSDQTRRPAAMVTTATPGSVVVQITHLGSTSSISRAQYPQLRETSTAPSH